MIPAVQVALGASLPLTLAAAGDFTQSSVYDGNPVTTPTVTIEDSVNGDAVPWTSAVWSHVSGDSAITMNSTLNGGGRSARVQATATKASPTINVAATAVKRLTVTRADGEVQTSDHNVSILAHGVPGISVSPSGGDVSGASGGPSTFTASASTGTGAGGPYTFFFTPIDPQISINSQNITLGTASVSYSGVSIGQSFSFRCQVTDSAGYQNTATVTFTRTS